MTQSLEQTALKGIEAMIRLMGDDPERDGLKDSPARFLKAMKEMSCGYEDDPVQILSKRFDQSFDELIISRNIPFHSLCEHHFLPFTGTASIGYIPASIPYGEVGADLQPKVVGLSKLARLLDCYSRRLQIQERLTTEIADALETELHPAGIGVVIKAEHSCMSCRGVRKSGSEMITSVFRGVLRNKPEARAEFLNLIRG